MKKNYYFLILCVIIIILLPIILNFVLQQTAPEWCTIIKDPNIGAPATWLAFWGAYLAAVGSFFMAYVSYVQNDEIRKQNKARIEYERSLREYEELEHFVLVAEQRLSCGAFEILCDSIPHEGTMESIHYNRVIQLYEINLKKLDSLSLKILQDKKWCQEYYSTFNKLHKQVEYLLNVLLNLNNVNYDSSYSKFRVTLSSSAMGEKEKFIQYVRDTMKEEDINKLHVTGINCLRSAWKNVMNNLSNT